MNGIDPIERIDVIKAIARKAGDAILEIYNDENVEVELKKSDTDGFVSPLTKADQKSHEIIVSELNKEFPELRVVSEEQDEKINLSIVNDSKYFIIDPIDGTKGFVKRDGEFTINIALIEKDTPVLGVVFVPVHNQMYFNDKDGAKLEENGQVKEIRASESKKAKNVVASKSHLEETTEKFLKQFGDINIVQAGSSLKICRVATGEAELYPRLSPTSMEWDVAAADAVLRAAGGKMINEKGEVLVYGKLPELRNSGFLAHAPNVEFSL